MRFFRRNKTAIDKQLTVNFIGESAADAGGPRREYFMLLMEYIVSSSGLLQGINGYKVFTFNPVLLNEKTYFEAGRMVATALQQDGPGLRCLSPYTYSVIVNKQDISKLTVNDIADFESREKVMKVQ